MLPNPRSNGLGKQKFHLQKYLLRAGTFRQVRHYLAQLDRTGLVEGNFQFRPAKAQDDQWLKKPTTTEVLD